MALKFKFAFSILLVYQVKLVLLIFIKIVLLHRLIYYFIFDNRSVQIIDVVGVVEKKTSEAGGKYKMTFISLDNVFAKMYNTMISKIYALFYAIKLNIKFIDVFNY